MSGVPHSNCNLSSLSCIKNGDDKLRVALSSTGPNIEQLCSLKQAQISHWSMSVNHIIFCTSCAFSYIFCCSVPPNLARFISVLWFKKGCRALYYNNEKKFQTHVQNTKSQLILGRRPKQDNILCISSELQLNECQKPIDTYQSKQRTTCFWKAE